MNIIQKPIKHFNERAEKIEFLIIHCMAFNIDDCLKCFNEFEVSSHYVIEKSGQIYQLVDEEKRSYHAGVAFWNEIDKDMNSRSIGIELESSTLGQTPYSDEQLKSLKELSKDIMTRHNIKPINVIGHSDIAPLRKPDPGKCFPWQDFSVNGIGIWFNINNADKIKENDVKTLLSSIGYDVRDEETLIASAYAFRRKFIPEEINIIDDIYELLKNCYPKGEIKLLEGEKFIKTLKAVVFEHQQIRTK